MTRAGRLTVAATTTALTLSALPGCSAHRPPDSGTPTHAAAVESPDRAAPGTVAVEETPSVPASTAGTLSLRSFPAPRDLGPRWRFSVDPGSAEDGYRGNGTPALARDPAEVVRTAVPLGCSRPRETPAPEHSLEVDYRYRGVPVVALKSGFTSAARARAFFAARASNLRACRGRVSMPAEGPLVRRVERVAAGVLLSDRTPDSAPWSELAVVRRNQVVLLAARAPLGTPPLTADAARRLAQLFTGGP